MVQPLRQQSLLVVSERQKGSAQGRILGGPRGPWPPLFLWKFENYFYRILACFPATGFLNFLDPPPASADRLEQNLGDNLWSSPGLKSWPPFTRQEDVGWSFCMRREWLTSSGHMIPPPANRSQITVILRYLPVSWSHEKRQMWWFLYYKYGGIGSSRSRTVAWWVRWRIHKCRRRRFTVYNLSSTFEGSNADKVWPQMLQEVSWWTLQKVSNFWVLNTI